MNAPIDEHALLVAVRQNARIARLAEPLQAYWIGKQVDEVLESFVWGIRGLCLPSSAKLSWLYMASALGSEL